VIHAAWPAQQRGQVAIGGIEMLNRFQSTLATFEPATEGQKIIHAEALREFNELVEARDLRLDAVVNTGLPSVLWVVVLAGAVIGLMAAFFFKVEDLRLHAILVTLLAAFMGLVIFMIFAFDRPFRGDLGLTPEPYQLVYDKVMHDAP
jgi:ribose/xylose/arabinose/galactoside ABC-type transport system permease subunit